MLDSFAVAMESGFQISDYRYVGMGGNRFYDFILVHKFLGIENMISLEHDEKMLPRAFYNLPYKFIKILNMNVYEFISSDSFLGNTIYWMDYDGSIRPDIARDIASLVPRIKSFDFVFFTVCGSPPRRLRDERTANRLIEVKEMFGDLASGVTREDMENVNFPEAVHKVLDAAFTNAFVVRREGVFRPFFQVRYTDGLDMLTFGGVFAPSQEYSKFEKLLEMKVPFLSSCRLQSYKIKKFDLTERERVLFDRAATTRRSNGKERNEIWKLGFREEDLDRYRELLRYHPRYVETLI